jgi:hypothetical protein
VYSCSEKKIRAVFDMSDRTIPLLVDRFHGSAHHDDRCTAGCEAHTNSADESACLTADNVRNEVVTIHRSHEVLKMLSLYTQISSVFNCFVKKTQVQQPFLHLQHTNFHSMERNFVGETPVAIILRIYVSLQVKPRFIRKECQLRIDVTFDDRPTTKTNPASWIAWLQGVRGLLSFYRV